MTTVRGRILRTWQQGDLAWLKLVAADVRHSLPVCSGLELDVEPGDIVALQLDAEGRVALLSVLSRPASGAWQPQGDGMRWRNPTGDRHSRMSLLHKRCRAIRAIRAYFEREGFLEAQTPLLVKGACPEPHLEAFTVGQHCLSTSTEYQIKRLLVGGFEKVVTLTQNFRAGELSPTHNPEFTMLEWARAYESLDTIEQDIQALILCALEAVAPGADSIVFGAHTVQLRGSPWQRLSVREALRQHLGMDVAADFSLESLRAECARTQQPVPPEFLEDHLAVVSFLIDSMTASLGTTSPVFLYDWPAFMTTSAASDRPANAARSELFIAGIEISDGFPALTDPELQRTSFETALTHRRQSGMSAVGLDTAYLEALQQGMPPASGMAMGVDRLLMVLLNEPEIHRVLPFGWDEL